MNKRLKVGIILLLFGFILFIFSFVKINSETVIDAAFTVEAGMKIEPYNEPFTYYHTTVFSKSVLIGELSVEEGSILFSVEGSNVDELHNVFVEATYSFKIDPADDQYTFTFDNTQGMTVSEITFVLKEEWTQGAKLLEGISLYLLIPIGLILIIFDSTKSRSNTSLTN